VKLSALKVWEIFRVLFMSKTCLNQGF